MFRIIKFISSKSITLIIFVCLKTFTRLAVSNLAAIYLAIQTSSSIWVTT